MVATAPRDSEPTFLEREADYFAKVITVRRAVAWVSNKFFASSI